MWHGARYASSLCNDQRWTMSDLADNAGKQLEFIEQVQERNRLQRQENKKVSDDCMYCDSPIPQARQDATGGTDSCIACAEYNEVTHD